MPRTHHMMGNFLGGIGNAAVRRAVKAINGGPYTGYEQTTASGTSTGLNGPNRVRNSATLVAEPNLVVGVVGNLTWLISGSLSLALTAAQGIKLDFNASTSAIVAGTMGGVLRFNITGASSTAVALTALNTSADGGTSTAWTSIDFWFTALFSQSGSVGIEFAQSSAGASNTDILPGSYIEAVPLDYFNQSA